ncbi:MAG TPA: hypothetical protein ENK44_11870 [Caldithrix abyssi]|uniref:Transporter n=1 Tax=Caldithrix abyssi TaxID=187145 RepID=A0A7V4U1M4_CALAY|nr:hypothetical protein [Caldithrix abyssi]
MRKSLLFMLLLGILLIGNAFASGVGLTTAGSRAVNLGGAYRALSNDWSGGFWNPAGLTDVDNWNMGLNVSVIIPSATLTPAQFEGHRYSGYADFEVKNVPQTFYIPTFGVVKSLDNGLSLGFGFFAPFGLGAQWDLFNPVPGYNNKTGYPEIDYESNLEVLDFHISAAYKFSERFSLGVGFGILKQKILIRNPSLSKPFYNTPLQPLVIAPHDILVTEVKLEGEGIGYSFNAGLKYKVSDQLSIGASVRYYPDTELKGKINATNYFPSDTGAVATLTDLYNAGVIDYATYLSSAAALSGETMTYINDDDAKATLPLPMNAGIGIAYHPTEDLLLAFDVDWTQWSSWNKIKLENITAVDGSNQDTELVEEWNDVLRYSFGLEYIAMRSATTELALRLGYYNDGTPIPDKTIGPSIPDANTKNQISLGGGLKMGDFTVNLMYSHIFIQDRQVSSWEISKEDYGNENVAGLYTAKVDEFHIGLEYNF